MKLKSNIELASGRIVAHQMMLNGAQEAYMKDGEPMSGVEWNEYCEKTIARSRRNAKAKASREMREDAYRSCGLVKVKGAISGRTYWE